MTEIYRELETMRVPLDHSSIRGTTYLLEKLQECRRYQDRLLTLTSEVEQALAGAKRMVRATKAALSIAGLSAQAPHLRAQSHEAQDALDDLRGLATSLNYARQNMKVTDSDIRLASGLVDLQFKLGEVRPPEPSLTAPTETTLTTATPAPDPVTTPVVKIEPPDLPKIAAEVFATDPRPAAPAEALADVDDISAFLSEVR
jgi:hypothetical protein